MRIIGGKYRGLKLPPPPSDHIRPTTDRMRETLFNMLEHGAGPGIRNARVLDLFCGTGALGIEAISRGASHATFVDTNPKSLNIARQNYALLKNAPDCSFIQGDATLIRNSSEPFGIVFIDPPYNKGLILPALKNIEKQSLLTKEAVIVIEYASNEQIDIPNGFEELKKKKISDATFSILKLTS